VLIDQGQPRAEIILAEAPERSVRLAAHELQESLAKISGTRLPIRTAPSGGKIVKLFVGESPHTKALGLDSEGLGHGAYRLVSGADWIAFLGDNNDFVPKEPWAPNNDAIRTGKLQSQWDAITGENWGVPNATMYKHRLRLPDDGEKRIPRNLGLRRARQLQRGLRPARPAGDALVFPGRTRRGRASAGNGRGSPAR
jgi:hypothetical protein